MLTMPRFMNIFNKNFDNNEFLFLVLLNFSFSGCNKKKKKIRQSFLDKSF